jgi:hypothetical protein
MEGMKMKTLNILNKFVSQRPGLSFADYDSNYYYNQDYRGILQAKHDFERMSAHISNTSISDEDLIKSSSSAFSGRLSLTTDSVEYCAGQYFPTEYRAAACAVLAYALWQYWRACGYSSHKEIQNIARATFGRGIASRWFS